ncbi:MAG TPA: 23S rRNA (uracil(1939)-C(5))-methyltransferase RlmD [Steroidobacteraceae bacterium]|nr:23S rRNA (uracil(1939)-C(5))-methyltransferase RlmD [Steroidobacteraceae bacterium]
MKRRPAHPGHETPRQPGIATSVRLVQIEKPVYNGSFLARDEGKAVFVPFTLPGEQVRVRLLEDKRSYATAELVEVMTSAPERIAPACPHFGPCGGCHYQHASYESQLQFKQAVLRETLTRGGITPPQDITVLAGPQWAYRNRVRFAMDPRGGPAYRGRRSHSFVPIRECPITAPLLVSAAFAAAGLIPAFLPGLRTTEMALFTNAEETALLLSIFIERPSKIRFDDFALELQRRIPQLAGAELVVESGTHQAPRTLARWGETSLAYHAAGADYRVDQGAFFQVNRWLVDALVERVCAGQSGELAWDLFAGVGLFARRLALSFGRVVAVESAPAATGALAANLHGTNGEAVRSSTLQFLRENRGGEPPQLIVVDPPRTGLGPEITALIAEIAPPALVYVSCDPATLARDLRTLLAAGYFVESVTLADLFPQTFHLETVVRMRLP